VSCALAVFSFDKSIVEGGSINTKKYIHIFRAGRYGQAVAVAVRYQTGQQETEIGANRQVDKSRQNAGQQLRNGKQFERRRQTVFTFSSARNAITVQKLLKKYI